MATRYIRHPEGYPQVARRIVCAGNRWAIETDTWDTATSHQGWRRGESRYKTKAEAEQVLARLALEAES